MAIEYWLEMECRVRELFGADRFKDMLKSRLIAIGMLDRHVGGDMTEADAQKQEVLLGRLIPESTRRAGKYTIMDALEDTKILDVLVDQ